MTMTGRISIFTLPALSACVQSIQSDLKALNAFKIAATTKRRIGFKFSQDRSSTISFLMHLLLLILTLTSASNGCGKKYCCVGSRLSFQRNSLAGFEHVFDEVPGLLRLKALFVFCRNWAKSMRNCQVVYLLQKQTQQV